LIRSSILAATALALGTGSAFAQFPERAITLVVPYGAGSTTDTLARVIGDKAGEILGQPIIVENRAGAGGIIGTEFVAGAEADGYTIIFAANQTHATNVSLYPDLTYDPIEDFTPIANLVMQPQVLVVNADLPANSVAELAELAQTTPQGLAFASTGIGTGAHLSGELFGLSTSSELVHVPYNGSEAITAVLTGTAQFMFYPYLPLKGHIDNGTIRLLAGTSPERVAWLPDTPTMVEAGYPDFVMSSWFAVYGPVGMDAETTEILSNAFLEALSDESVAETLSAGGSVSTPGGPQDLADFTKTEISRAADIVERSGVTIE
jgi:tripartite-type tricarboxylate transporter receptor subunit TctC